MEHAAQTVVEFTNVQFSYAEQAVLKDVSFRIKEREMIGIIGPNGSGKTTLLRCILGLLRPDSGEVRVFGSPPSQVSNRLGYVPQHLNFDARFPVTALDVVLMGLVGSSGFGPYSKRLKEKALHALEMVELVDFKNRGFAELSGGQRQRVLIARALSTSPRMLLFDEPTANVDSSSGEKLYNLLDQLNKEMTILVVSHDVGFVNHNISSVLCVNRTVRVHPTSALTGRNILDLYGEDMAMIQHHQHAHCKGDHKCSTS